MTGAELTLLEDPSALKDYLVAQHGVDPDAPIQVILLSGGISNRIAKVVTAGPDLDPQTSPTQAPCSRGLVCLGGPGPD